MSVNPNPPYEPQTIGYYTQRLKAFVPKKAYKAATYKLIPMSIHVALVFTYIYIINQFPENWWVLAGLSVLMGASYACVFLYCHEMSHGSIIKREPYRYIASLFFWSFSGMPPTMWEKIHNFNHHKNMNNYKDPDRRTFKSEKNFWNTIYNFFCYPNKTMRFSLTVGTAMIFYTSKHILSVFYPEGSKPAIVTYKPYYTAREKRIIFFEFLFVLAMQGLIFFLLGWANYLIVSAISWVIYSTGLISMIITQHQRNAHYKDTADPMLTTTSVIVHPFFDRLIDWHSYHVEHHIFPGMNFDYYPELSKHIQQQFPEKYDRIPFVKGVKEAFEYDVFHDDPLT